MGAYSYQITKKQYDYMLPIYGIPALNKLHSRIDRKIEKFYFIGTENEYLEMLNRCKYINLNNK